MNTALTLEVLDDWQRADVRSVLDRVVPPTLDEWDRAIKALHRAERRVDEVFGRKVYPRLRVEDIPITFSIAPSQSLLTPEEQTALHIVVPEPL